MGIVEIFGEVTPLKGSTLKNPLRPKTPAKPKAQEEQAGVSTLVMIPVKPIPAL